MEEYPLQKVLAQSPLSHLVMRVNIIILVSWNTSNSNGLSLIFIIGCQGLWWSCHSDIGHEQASNQQVLRLKLFMSQLLVTFSNIHLNYFFRKVQSAAAAAIRNIVSRNKELCAAFIERGVEQLLSTAMEHHREKIGDTIRNRIAKNPIHWYTILIFSVGAKK